MFYHCTYDTYRHHVWAETEKEARKIIKKYGFVYHGGDTQPHEYRPSVLAKLEGGLNRHDVIHSICFLSFLAQRLGIESDRICGDQSALHSLIHYRQFGIEMPQHYKRQIAEGIIFLEGVVLGLPPKNVELHIQILGKYYGPPPCLNEPFDVEDWKG